MSISLDSDIGRDLDLGLRALGLDATLAGPLLAYLGLLDRWNHTYNLTAVRDPRDMVGKHLLDSLAMVPFAAAVTTLADLGSGPGLPGIPLAIALPALRVTLVESNGKKARFLREAVRTLALDNARVAECRAEALDEPRAYQAITARALATLPQIVAVGGHLLGEGGRLLAMKGARPDDEVAALPPGWQLRELHRLQVPGLTAERHLAIVGRVAGGGVALRA